MLYRKNFSENLWNSKGSGMIHPNLATTLGYIFTDADLTNDILTIE